MVHNNIITSSELGININGRNISHFLFYFIFSIINDNEKQIITENGYFNITHSQTLAVLLFPIELVAISRFFQDAVQFIRGSSMINRRRPLIGLFKQTPKTRLIKIHYDLCSYNSQNKLNELFIIILLRCTVSFLCHPLVGGSRFHSLSVSIERANRQ